MSVAKVSKVMSSVCCSCVRSSRWSLGGVCWGTQRCGWSVFLVNTAVAWLFPEKEWAGRRKLCPMSDQWCEFYWATSTKHTTGPVTSCWLIALYLWMKQQLHASDTVEDRLLFYKPKQLNDYSPLLCLVFFFFLPSLLIAVFPYCVHLRALLLHWSLLSAVN